MRQKSWRDKIPYMEEKDTLYRSHIRKAGDFVFDERVVRVFPDMINRSVPGYGLIVPMIGLMARQYARDFSNLYDLGCSLGAVSLAMRAAVRSEGVRIRAVDNSPDMIRQLQALLEEAEGSGLPEIEPVYQDILETPIENASVVVLNFTLQFVDPPDRTGLLQKIARGLVPGGVLLLSEKIRFPDSEEQSLQTRWHEAFKRTQGYSELEIARKRDALENVMKPDTFQQHRDRLAEAGFHRVYRWFQGLNFVSMIAMH